MSTHLHFTFSPVQGFVAQARRTRDLFCGSFLLSHLALTAIHAARDAHGKIILPDLSALAATAKHAGAPNRFLAEFDDEPTAARAAAAATTALKNEWQKIATAVWEKFVAPVASAASPPTASTAKIWKRQIENFWEISWAIGTETDLLDRRKNWRTPPLSIEGGDHCSLMGEWQELSGFIRSRQRREQDAFWAKLRSTATAATHNTLNLDTDERLCAIALVKRFFPDVAKAAIQRDLDASAWPSTADIAAAPWRRKITTAAKENLKVAALLRDFPDFASRHAGNFLNRTALENERDTPLPPDSRHTRRELLDALTKLETATRDRAGNFYAILLMDGDHMGALIRQHGAANITAALTAFSAETPAIVRQHDGECVYAGGDDLLALLPLDTALACAAAIRQHYLHTFTTATAAAVPSINERSEQTPPRPAASGIGEAQRSQPAATATISATVVFAHYQVALRRVLHHAHQCLDNDAKDAASRDAIALSVLKPGGETCRWVAKFAHFLPTSTATPTTSATPVVSGVGAAQRSQPATTAPVPSVSERSEQAPHPPAAVLPLATPENCFTPLIAKFRDDPSATPATSAITLSSKFLYNLRSRFTDFRASHDDLVRLFTAELIHGRLASAPAAAATQRTAATALMRKLTHLCTHCLPATTAPHAAPATAPTTEPPHLTPNFAGARLIRFLALGGKEGNE
jgi:CRISPR-associated protein Cmr2